MNLLGTEQRFQEVICTNDGLFTSGLYTLVAMASSSREKDVNRQGS